jgi:glycosyltransferase involved in cell wall biosynthesis
MRARQFDPLYLPHGVDCNIYKPPRNRRKIRQSQGLDQHFLVGVCAGNYEKGRKNFDKIMQAFAVFHGEHPKSLLMLHVVGVLPEGQNLWKMAEHYGITDACIFSDQYQQIIGAVTQDALAAWYGALDVLIMVGNEGVGLPTVEAMACGTPVIGGDWGPTPELMGSTGWLVAGEKDWQNWHHADWHVPLTESLLGQLEAAHRDAKDRRAAARSAALEWDADKLWDEHWAATIKTLDG